MHNILHAPMISESLSRKPVPRDEIFRLIYEGARIVPPIALESGSFYFPQGVYQICEGPSGERIGLWAPDPDVLKFSDLSVDKALAARLQKYNGAQEPVPVKKGDVLPQRLNHDVGKPFPEIRIFTAKPTYRAEKWLLKEMTQHQIAFREFTLDQGFLIRESPYRWTSGGIVYQLVPARKKNGHKGKFDLVMTVAPGYGWQLGENFHKLFKSGWLSGAFMRAASMYKRNITFDEAEKFVVEDFSKRAPLFIEGMDPYGRQFLHNGRGAEGWQYPRKKSLAGILARNRVTRNMMRTNAARGMRVFGRKRYIRRNVLHMVYGMKQMSLKDWVVSAGILASSVVILGGIAHAFGFPVDPMVMAGRWGGKTFTKTTQRIAEYAAAHERRLSEPGVENLYRRYGLNSNPRQLWGPRLDPNAVPYLQAMDHGALNTDQGLGFKIYKSLPKNLMALTYIRDTLRPPIGSCVTPFESGNYKGVRIDERNGLSVEYIVDQDVCYACLGSSADPRVPLPDSVEALFARQHKSKPYIKVYFDEALKRPRYIAMTAEEYRADFAAVTEAPFTPLQAKHSRKPIRLVPPPVKRKQTLLDKIFGRHASETATQVWEEGVENLSEGAAGKFPLIPH